MDQGYDTLARMYDYTYLVLKSSFKLLNLKIHIIYLQKI